MINAEDHWFWNRFLTRFRLPSVWEAVPDPCPPPVLEAVPQALPPVWGAVPDPCPPPVLEAVPQALPPVLEAVPDPYPPPPVLEAGPVPFPPPRSHGSARNASYGEVAAVAG